MSNIDKIEFYIAGNVLIRSKVISGIPYPKNVFVDREPIITKEAFIKCYNEWIKNDETDNSGGAKNELL